MPPPPRFTRTHTHYFAEDELRPIAEALAALRADWESRRPYIDAETAAAGDRRLAVAIAGVELLGEPAG